MPRPNILMLVFMIAESYLYLDRYYFENVHNSEKTNDMLIKSVIGDKFKHP